MFTVKLIKGEITKLIEARDVEVRKFSAGGTDGSKQHAIIVEPGPDGMPNFYHYLGNTGDPHEWDRAIIENANGKTTEIVDAPLPPQETGRAIRAA